MAKRFEPVDQTWFFNGTPMFVTLPVEIGGGEPVPARLEGSWVTRLVSRDEFEIVDLDACIVIPSISGRLDPKGDLIELEDLEVPLSLAKVRLPAGLREEFGKVNCGVLQPRGGFVRSSLGLRAHVPPIGRQEIPPAEVALKSIGWVARDGVVMQAGVGTVLRGLLRGTILCCASKPPVEKPKPCGSNCRASQDGPTYDGNPFSDFERVNIGGAIVKFKPDDAGAPSASKLGRVHGTYPPPGAGNVSEGCFVKLEVHVKAPAPCSIVSVERTRRTLGGHENVGQVEPDGPDGPGADSVRKPDPAHHWVVTDAPGFIIPAGGTTDLSFAKQYTVTATCKDKDGNLFEVRCTYDVKFETDAAGEFK
jgi:hypothetical protein